MEQGLVLSGSRVFSLLLTAVASFLGDNSHFLKNEVCRLLPAREKFDGRVRHVNVSILDLIHSINSQWFNSCGHFRDSSLYTLYNFVTVKEVFCNIFWVQKNFCNICNVLFLELKNSLETLLTQNTSGASHPARFFSFSKLGLWIEAGLPYGRTNYF